MTLPSVELHARKSVQDIFALILAQGQGDYIGEAVSQVQHSLQAATLAQQSGADDETVIGALLHDVGRFIPEAEEMASMIAPDGTYIGKASHEILGEQFLRQVGFSEKVCQLVGAHVMAKRYLCATEDGYWDALSKSSKQTLEFQGGVFNDEEVKESQKDPFLLDKLAVRRWDDQAKDPSMKTPALEAFEDMTVTSLLRSWSDIELHGRTYSLPTRPIFVICVDGFDPEPLDQGIEDGVLPNFAQFVKHGFHATAICAMPSFTDPNDVTTITGASISTKGIVGDYYLDPKTGKEHMIMNDLLLQGSTILELMSKRGVRVAALTTKDKSRRILSHDLQDSICFSAEQASICSMMEDGIESVESWLGRPQPSQYSDTFSLFVLDAGIKLLEEHRADLFYLTLSDSIQHKHSPDMAESDAFWSDLDRRIGRLVELGARVAVTSTTRL